MATARNNLHFLREFCAGGYSVAGFCRALPYVGTPMEERMRLKAGSPDRHSRPRTVGAELFR